MNTYNKLQKTLKDMAKFGFKAYLHYDSKTDQEIIRLSCVRHPSSGVDPYNKADFYDLYNSYRYHKKVYYYRQSKHNPQNRNRRTFTNNKTRMCLYSDECLVEELNCTKQLNIKQATGSYFF